MRQATLKFLLVAVLLSFLANLSGCAALKKKFTPKKAKPKVPVYYQMKEYDIKPSMELYEKHYIFWINWHKKMVAELGSSFKNDLRCAQEIRSNLEDMVTMLVDEEAEKLIPHVEEMSEIEVIIEKRNMTKVNETRIRRILEREYRSIKRDFSPKKMTGFIRKEWKED